MSLYMFVTFTTIKQIDCFVVVQLHQTQEYNHIIVMVPCQSKAYLKRTEAILVNVKLDRRVASIKIIKQYSTIIKINASMFR